MKFKAGDRVKVRKDLEVGNYYNGICFAPGMGKYRGLIITIEGILHYDGFDAYLYHGYSLVDEMLETVEEEKKMRNIDMIANNEKLNKKHACYACYDLKNSKDSCCVMNCSECEFNNVKACFDFLQDEYKGPKIKLSKFEYDLLDTYIKKLYSKNDKISDYGTLKYLKQKGYFKDVDLDLTFKYILDNCEIEEEK